VADSNNNKQAQSVTSEGINERAQVLLKTLVERYIRDGQPVGSKALAENTQLDLSPATIRNVIADLERLGLVHAPHTSAGRVPTELGYRLFIDNLVTIKPLQSAEVETLSKNLNPEADTSQLVETASSMLSGLTQMAGVVMMPFQKQVALRQIEFLPLSENRVLAILVFNEREVQNRVLNVSRTYTLPELERISNYLNQEFIGKDVNSVRTQLLTEMQGAQKGMDQMQKCRGLRRAWTR